MVGRPRPERCATCRKRKLKCDEVKPDCGQCLSSGWTCPGYARTWEFRQISKVTSQAVPRRGKPLQTANPCWIRPEDRASQTYLSNALTLNTIIWSSSDRLFHALCWSIKHDKVNVGLIWLPIRPYLSVLPQLVGHSNVFDKAITCILQPLCENIYQPDAYTHALRTLRVELGRAYDRLDICTIAAILVLQMFENNQRPGGQYACMHAKGYIRAVIAAGPALFTNTASQFILTAGLGLICTQSLRESAHCILEEPAWQEVLKAKLPRADLSVSLMRELAQQLARFPGLVHDFRRQRHLQLRHGRINSDNNHADSVSSIALTQRLDSYSTDIRQWLSTLQEAEQPAVFSEYQRQLVAFQCLATTSLAVTNFLLRYMTEHVVHPEYLRTLPEFESGIQPHVPLDQIEVVGDIHRCLQWLQQYAMQSCVIVLGGIEMMTEGTLTSFK